MTNLCLYPCPTIICEWWTFNLILDSFHTLIHAFCAARTSTTSTPPSATSFESAKDCLPFRRAAASVLSNTTTLPGLRAAIPVYLDDMMMVRRASDHLSVAMADMSTALTNLFSCFQDDPSRPIDMNFYDLSPSEAKAYSTPQH